MTKIKNWLREKLILFLGIEELLKIFDKHIDHNHEMFEELYTKIADVKEDTIKNTSVILNIGQEVSHLQNSISTLENTVKNVVSIGVDQHPQGSEQSWAVICIEGNYNVVKFVDLKGQPTKDILNFLKQFEVSRRVIDSPYYKMFDQELLKI